MQTHLLDTRTQELKFQNSLKILAGSKLTDNSLAAELDMPSLLYSRCAVSTTAARPIEADLVDLPNAVNAVPLSDYLGPALNSAFNNPTEDPNMRSDKTYSIVDFKVPDAVNNPASPLGFCASDMIQWRRLLRRAARSGVIRLSLEHADPRTAAGARCVEHRADFV